MACDEEVSPMWQDRQIQTKFLYQNASIYSKYLVQYKHD